MIGLVGAHRVGKTTLAKAYAEQTDIEFVQTDSTGVFKKYGMSPKVDYHFRERLFIQNKILEDAERRYKAANSDFITDRTPLDMLAYTLADVQRENTTMADAALLMDYIERCYEATNKHFASIIVVQPGIPIVDDPGKAPANPAYIEHIALLIMGLVVDQRLKSGRHYIGRSNLDMNTRIQSVHNAMGNVYQRHLNEIADNEHFH